MCGLRSRASPSIVSDLRSVPPPMLASPADLVNDALRQRARVVVSTYNEPLITSEWAVAVFKEAKAAGLITGFVSNGNGTPQVLDYIRPWVDLYKVDLKSFDDRHYRELGGRIEPILDTIRRLHEMAFWVEIVTLLIPGFNDSPDELTRAVQDNLRNLRVDVLDVVNLRSTHGLHEPAEGSIEASITVAVGVGPYVAATARRLSVLGRG